MKKIKVIKEIKTIKDLFTKNLLFLTNSMVFSEFGNVVYNTALSFWILDITNSTLLMGWMSFISIMPQLLLSPFIGIYVDRHNNKKIIVFMDILRGISMCLFGIITLFGINNIVFILINSILLSISNCFYQTSINASLINIFPKGKFVEANAISNSIINFSEVFAASISGILLSILIAPILFIINGITFFISAISNSFLNLPVENFNCEKKNIKDELLFTVNLCKKNKKLIKFILIRCLLGFLLRINLILIIPLFNIKYNKIFYGFANSFLMIGTLIGGISLIYVKKYLSENKILFLSIIITAIAIISISNINNICLIFIFMLLLGVSLNIYNILTESNIVLLVPKEHRAKSLSIIFQIIFLFIGFGNLLGGFLGNYINIPLILTLNSFLILIISIIYYKYQSKNFEIQ